LAPEKMGDGTEDEASPYRCGREMEKEEKDGKRNGGAWCHGPLPYTG